MDKENRESLVSIDAVVSKEIAPDQIWLTICFEGELETKERCVEQYNKDLESVLTALESCGIDRKTVKQSRFKVYPHKEVAYKKYEESEDDFYRAFEFIEGYEYRGLSLVKLPADAGVFGTTWLALLETEGEFTYDFEYGLKDETATESELLKEAIAEARSRADMLAAAAGAELGIVKSIVHSFKGAKIAYCCSDLNMYGSAPVDYGGTSEPLIPDFNPDDISVSCNVSVSWYLVI